MSTDDKDREGHPKQQHDLLDSKEQAQKMSSSASTQAIASIGSYCLANMAMTVTNKYVFSVSFSCVTFEQFVALSRPNADVYSCL
jgi:hypothetical protein